MINRYSLHKILLLTITMVTTSLIGISQPAGYGFGKQILVQSSQVAGTANLTDFTVLVNFTDPNLRTTANGGNVENANGFDITFTQGDCSTPLDHQIERYNPTTGEYIAWIRIPSLSPTVDFAIHMFYGNSAITADPSTVNAWEANYEGVWHMNNSPNNSALTDYSGNAANGTSAGAMTATDLVAGQIGNAIDFDGTNDYFAIATKNYTNVGEIPQISVSAWVNTTFVDNTNGQFRNWSILDFDRSEYFNFFIHGDGRLGFSSWGGGIHDSYAGNAGDLNDGSWHHVVGVYDGTNKLYYIDGALALTVNNPHGGNAIGRGSRRFGFIGDGSEANAFNGNRNNIYYDGMYDEIRFTTNALSADWIQTEFNNQSSPATFYTISAEFTAFDLCATLPIDLLNLYISPSENNEISILWQTASEINNDFFTIERSLYGIEWETVSNVYGAGNSSSILSYSEIDENPYAGISYYRLKQTDFDGDFEYSEVKTVINNSTEELSLKMYPNPFKEQITLIGSEKSLENITIYNTLGQDVTSQATFKNVSKTKIIINFSALNKGGYFLKTKGKTYKILKQY